MGDFHVTRPHYVLVAETAPQNGRWSFKLGRSRGAWELWAADTEPEMRDERLELLAVIRGLEAVDGPAQVTLWSSAPGLRRRIERGLLRWELAQFRAGRPGSPLPVENADLWRRIDRLLKIHQVQFRRLRLDGAHEDLPCEPHAFPEATIAAGVRSALARFCSRLVPWASVAC